ncbi:glycosyltransferase [Candidatus Collierbacteria bacterium]|nr:glycosyltransferase [Candidatus Collierbacteria bacterium]
MKTSLIIPLWNHLEDLTKPFVASLLACRGDFELILVDNGSTDGTAKYLKQIKDKRVVVVESKKNLGFGGGSNLGYRRAKGNQICFLSNDVLIHDKDWILFYQKVINEHPKWLIGPMYVDYNDLTMFRFKHTPYIAGWCMYGAKSMFDAAVEDNQVFDESMGLAYFEDVFLSARLAGLGYTLREVPADLVHLGSKSSDQIDITAQMKFAQRQFYNRMTMLDLERRRTKRIVFFAAGVPYPFTDGDFEEKGVGGAESALILLSRTLAGMGYRVEIYNRTTKAGTFGGVYYDHIDNFRATDYCDVFVLFRSFHQSLHQVNAITKIFWSCDQYTDPEGIWNAAVFPKVDKTVCISPYHQKFLDRHYLTKGKTATIDLGVNWPDYQQSLPKEKGKAIFCSVPRRGLAELAKMVPEIKKKVPDFNLVITSDYRLWGQEDPMNGEFRDMFKNLPYVEFLGKIPRKELVFHQKTSQVMAYPSNYEECFCIAAMECMAAGAVPVTSDLGALSTTVGGGGVRLSNRDLGKKFVDSVARLLTDESVRGQYEAKGREIAKQHDWKLIAKEWVELINNMEQDLKQPSVSKIFCKECGRSMPNSYLLNRHIAAKHAVGQAAPPAGGPAGNGAVELPKTVLLRFKQPVECCVNGRKFAGDAIEVPFEYVPSVVEIIKTAYGPEVMA